MNPYAGQGFQQTRTDWVNKAAFAQPAVYTFGNEHRNDLVGPRYDNFDVNLSKNFPIYERLNLQFRSEFFNIFNHAHLSNPDDTFTDGTFGKILTSAAPGRQIQFALKLLF